LLVDRLADGEVRRKTMVAMTGKLMIVAIGAALVSVVPSPADAQARRVVSTRQDVAVARAGEVPALGTVSATLGWDQRMEVSLRESEFVMTRTYDARAPRGGEPVGAAKPQDEWQCTLPTDRERHLDSRCDPSPPGRSCGGGGKASHREL